MQHTGDVHRAEGHGVRVWSYEPLRFPRSPWGRSEGGYLDDKQATLISRFATQGEIPAGRRLNHTQEFCHVQCIYGVHAAHTCAPCVQQAAGDVVCAQQVLVELDGKGLLFAVYSLVFGEVGAPVEHFATFVTLK